MVDSKVVLMAAQWVVYLVVYLVGQSVDGWAALMADLLAGE